jgi:hypothetical protein
MQPSDKVFILSFPTWERLRDFVSRLERCLIQEFGKDFAASHPELELWTPPANGAVKATPRLFVGPAAMRAISEARLLAA